MAISVSGVANAQIPGSLSEDLNIDAVSQVSFTEDPCPEPQKALSETPNDLKIIQEDITRFTLCLQRAQLLSRLDELASKSIETIDSSLDEKMETIVSNFAPVIIPANALTIPAIPSMPNNTVEETMQPSPQFQPEPIFDYLNWTINTIKGVNGVLIANLSDANGNVVNTKTGQKIPNTDITIMAINQTSVRVREGNKAAKLKWSQ